MKDGRCSSGRICCVDAGTSLHLAPLPTAHRFEVVSYTSHKGRVFVVIGIFPVKEKSYALTEEQLHIQKSPTALGNEVVAYLDRVG